MVPIDVLKIVSYSCIDIIISISMNAASQNGCQISDIDQSQTKVMYISIRCISLDTVAGLLSFSDNS